MLRPNSDPRILLKVADIIESVILLMTGTTREIHSSLKPRSIPPTPAKNEAQLNIFPPESQAVWLIQSRQASCVHLGGLNNSFSSGSIMSKIRFDPVPSETSTTELVEAGR